MKRLLLLTTLIALVSVAGASSGLGTVAGIVQQGVARGPISTPRDPELERQCLHSLEVARYYFYKRKPPKGDKEGLERLNKGVESRLQEIVDINPTFGKMDEVFFLFGEVYLRGANPEEAAKAFSNLIKEFPDSEFAGEARKRLGELESQGKVKKGG
ncbi:MAG: hypothetical protein ABI882_04825 [Acidobacteriota bacterium]